MSDATYDPLQRFIQLVPAGSGVIYAIQADGTLYWYRNTGWETGSSAWANGGTGLQIGTGWHQFVQVISAGDGQTLYAFDASGNCHWYQYQLSNWNTGAGTWTGGGAGPVIGGGFQVYPRILQGGWNGAMFCMDNSGSLWWYQYTAGNGQGGSSAWANSGEPVKIGSGFQMLKRAWTEPNGVIYGATQPGELVWYRYLGSGSWANNGTAVQIGTGWGEDFQKTSFAMGSGVIYALTLTKDQLNGTDATLSWFQLTNSQSITPSSGTDWTNGGTAVTVGTGFTVEPGAALQGYAQSLSVAQGSSLSFPVSTTFSSYQSSVVQVNAAANPVTVQAAAQQSGGLQLLSTGYRANGCGWNPSVTVQATWPTGVYALQLTSPYGQKVYIPFVVKPTSPQAKIACLVPVNTYLAYNYWAGHSRYAAQDEVNDVTLSFQRPFSSMPVAAPGVISHTFYLDLFLWQWMAQNGIACDFYTDTDLDSSPSWLSKYKAVVIGAHPEYWSDGMRASIVSYLGGGGILIAVGGNNFYERSTYTYNTGNTTLTWSPFDNRDLFINHGEPEAQIIGGSYNLPAYMTFAPYTVQDAAHPMLAGTGLANGGTFGAAGYDGAASGWEENGPVDTTNVVGTATVLAQGSGQAGNGAAMVYINRSAAGGGWVFAANSIAFCGSLPTDTSIQQILKNVFAAAGG